MSSDTTPTKVRGSESLRVIRDSTYSLRPLVPPDVGESARRRQSTDGRTAPIGDVQSDAPSPSSPDDATARALSRELGDENLQSPPKYPTDACGADVKLVFEAIPAVRAPTPLDARDVQFFIDAKKAAQNLATAGGEVTLKRLDSGTVRVRRAATPS